MRARVGDKIFVQNYDLRFIVDNIRIYPEEIREKISKDQLSSDLRPRRSEFCFDYSFESKEALNWLENQCWLLDAKELSEKSEKEIKKELKRIKKEMKNILKRFLKNERYLNEDSCRSLISSMRIQKHIILSLDVACDNHRIPLFSLPKDA